MKDGLSKLSPIASTRNRARESRLFRIASARVCRRAKCKFLSAREVRLYAISAGVRRECHEHPSDNAHEAKAPS